VVSAWNIGQVAACRLVKRGEVNRNFILTTSRGKYILREVSHIHHKSPSDLEFELAYLHYLKAAGFPYSIPSVVPTTNRSSFVAVQGHYYWLYKFLEGTVVSRLNESRQAQLARMMATYHSLIERSNPKMENWVQTCIT
jgi:Ser/Thr protein kinase RdoA (MazF antagonist)